MSSVTIQFDNTELIRQLRVLRREEGEAGDAALTVMGDVMMDRLSVLWPRDTNRSIRGWVEAANNAGLTIRPLPAIKASKRHDLYIDALTRQIAAAEQEYAKNARFDDLYRLRGRTGEPYYRKIVSRKNKARKTADRGMEELAKAMESDGFLFMDRGGFVYGTNRGNLKNHNLKRLTTVRTKVYGGAGKRMVVNGQRFLELKNFEPHARIVERVARHGHPLRVAMSSVRVVGMRRASDAYMKKLGEKSTMVRAV